MTEPSPRREPRSLSLTLAPALVALAFGGWMLARRHYLLVDDAYISFRYAANLAHGDGLVWNPGVPVEGYTCLLWVLLLSCFAHGGLDLAGPAVALSSLYGLGCLELLRRIGRTVRPADTSQWQVVPGLLVASLPSFAHAMTSGMEETSFAFYALLGVHLLIVGRQRPRARIWAGVAFAAASLTRPEGPLIAAVAFAVEATTARVRLRELFAPAVCVGIVVVAHTAVRLGYYGYLFPNTFYAKVIFGRLTIERGAAHITGFILAGGWLLFLGWPRARHDPGTRPWIIHGYALAIVYGAYLLSVGGDHPHWFRFYVPLVPLPLLGVAEQLRAWTASMRRAGPAGRWLSAGCCSVVALSALPFSEANEPIVGVVEPPIKKLMDDVDRFFDEVPPDSFCAIEAIGYVGYRHLGLHILDIWGLTDTHIAHVKVAPVVKFGHDKQDLAYVGAMKPDYVYMFGSPSAPPFAGYDLCWPADNPPAVVYRRAFPLAANDRTLGVPTPRQRRIEPPPPCRPPAFLASAAPAR